MSGRVTGAKQGPKWLTLDVGAAEGIHFMPPTPAKLIIRNENTGELLRVMRRRRFGNRVRLYCQRSS